MLTRTTLLSAAVTALLAACSGSTKEFSSQSGGTGGTAGSGGSVGGSSGTGEDTGVSGEGNSPTGGGSTGKGGSGGASGSTGKGGTSGKGGGTSKGGTGGGTSGASGSSGAGTSGEGGAAPAGGGTSIDEAAASVAVDLCTKAFECCSAADLKALYGVDNVIGCEVAVAFLVQSQVNAAKPAIEAGRVDYDGTALDRCLGDYGDQSCDMLRTLTSFECKGLIVPKQGEGDECGISAECVDGYCDGSSNATNPVGHCVPLKDDGADCSANAECVSKFCNANLCAEATSQALCGG